MSKQKLDKVYNHNVNDELDDELDEEFFDAKETLDDTAGDFKAVDKTLNDTSGEISDQETVVDEENLEKDKKELDDINADFSDDETIADDEMNEQDLEDDFDDTASFVSALDVDPKIYQQTITEEIPQDITREELYLIRSALEETNRIKKIQAKKHAELEVEQELKRILVSEELDQKLDKYIELKEEKKEAEKREDIQAQIDIKGSISYQRGSIVQLPFVWQLYEAEMKDYNEKYDRIWDMWLERYDKVKYDSPKELKNTKKIDEYIAKNGLSLPKEEGKAKRIWNNIVSRIYGFLKITDNDITKLEKNVSKRLSILVSIKDNLIEIRNKLFKEPKEREILKALDNIDNMLDKDKKNDALLQERNNLIKLKYKYKIFRDTIKARQYNWLKPVLNKSVNDELKQINSRINKISREKKKANIHLHSKKFKVKMEIFNDQPFSNYILETKLPKVKDDILDSNKVNVSKTNKVQRKINIENEGESKPKGPEI